MLFNSLHFLLYFPTVATLYFLTPHRFRAVVLLIASYYFYAVWRADYLLIIIAITLLDYSVGRLLGRIDHPTARRALIAASLSVNLGVLFVFKYLDFVNTSLAAVMAGVGLAYLPTRVGLILPLGLSFHTFQTMSYTIDVYRRVVPPERSLRTFALYVAFFPQLVAGPIERASNMLHQFVEVHTFDHDRVTSGLERMLRGFFKKVVIADNAAPLVESLFSDPGGHRGPAAWILVALFAFQIYCDFSGYTDIAVGSARVLGFRLTENFRAPYLSRSISEFWRRWHMSLSSWFRDYVYFSLGGNRRGPARTALNLMVTFLLSGLWHGANWTFVVWGGLHGAMVTFESLVLRRRAGRGLDVHAPPEPGLKDFVLRVGATLLVFVVVCVAWIFFRAASLSIAIQVLGALVPDRLALANPLPDVPVGTLAVLAVSIAAMLIIEGRAVGPALRRLWDANALGARWVSYWAAILSIAFFGAFDQQKFIYFQF